MPSLWCSDCDFDRVFGDWHACKVVAQDRIYGGYLVLVRTNVIRHQYTLLVPEALVSSDDEALEFVYKMKRLA